MKTGMKRLLLTSLVVVIFAIIVIYLINHLVIGLDLDKNVVVQLGGRLPFSTHIEKQVDVNVNESLKADVTLPDTLSIPLQETFDIRLDMTIRVPIETDIMVDQTFHLDLKVPVKTTLTENELKLQKLEIPLDTDVYIDDEIDLDIVVPLDTEVKTLMGVTVPVKADIPIKMKVPVKQKVRIKDTLVVSVDSLSIPLSMTLQVNLEVPLKQSVHVHGVVEAPISQVVTVPLKKTIHARMQGAIPVTVDLKGKLPVQLKADFDSDVAIAESVQMQLGQLKLKAENLSFEMD